MTKAEAIEILAAVAKLTRDPEVRDAVLVAIEALLESIAMEDDLK